MELYENAWKNIVKPTQIKSKRYILGPSERIINGVKIVRIDMQVLNRNNKKISGFLFYCPEIESEDTLLFLHGNGGSKIEALSLVGLIPKYRINVVAFDFLGCGSSQAQVLTYGINQVFDIRDFLQEVRKYTGMRRVTIWGRSMGALCAIMFAQMYSYEVNGLILDSPFKSLSKVIDRIAVQSLGLAQFLLKPILYLVKKRAVEEVKLDIFSLDYLQIFKRLNSNMSVLFIFSYFDGIVPSQEVFEFYNCYKGPKDLCQIYQTHDEDRNEDLFNQAVMWLKRTKRRNIEGLVQAREHEYDKKKEKFESFRFC